jgi:hypothetical protein
MYLGRFMTVGTLPAFAPPNLKRLLIALTLALLFGLLSLAAVRETRVECRNQYLMLQGGGYLLLTGGSGRILLAGGRQQCQLVMGDVRVPLPAWAQAVIW